ncbi:hypothetical protein GS575_32550 [Rhodococcus hoagii]|nr:hypothetical protein [Prescottella equi]
MNSNGRDTILLVAERLIAERFGDEALGDEKDRVATVRVHSGKSTEWVIFFGLRKIS